MEEHLGIPTQEAGDTALAQAVPRLTPTVAHIPVPFPLAALAVGTGEIAAFAVEGRALEGASPSAPVPVDRRFLLALATARLSRLPSSLVLPLGPPYRAAGTVGAAALHNQGHALSGMESSVEQSTSEVQASDGGQAAASGGGQAAAKQAGTSTLDPAMHRSVGNARP